MGFTNCQPVNSDGKRRPKRGTAGPRATAEQIEAERERLREWFKQPKVKDKAGKF